jgi:hypothetical protein
MRDGPWYRPCPMPSVLAIVSKAIFERDAKVGKRLLDLGEVVPLDRYVSKNKGLSPLAEGGALFLVTVRPPDEALWLVAVLEAPTFDGENWVSPPNVVALRDISDLKDKLKFTSGSGISAKKGALGMSLQTPRVLTEEDEALLRAGVGALPVAAASPLAKGHLNAHDGEGRAPCLCRTCIGAAPDRITIDGLALVRDRAEAAGRFVWYWMPESLAGDQATIRRAVESRLHGKRKLAPRRNYENLDTVFASDEADGDDE